MRLNKYEYNNRIGGYVNISSNVVTHAYHRTFFVTYHIFIWAPLEAIMNGFVLTDRFHTPRLSFRLPPLFTKPGRSIVLSFFFAPFFWNHPGGAGDIFSGVLFLFAIHAASERILDFNTASDILTGFCFGCLSDLASSFLFFFSLVVTYHIFWQSCHFPGRYALPISNATDLPLTNEKVHLPTCMGDWRWCRCVMTYQQ